MNFTTLFQVLSIIISLYIAFTEKRKRIYIATFLLNITQLLLYFVKSDITTTIMYIFIVIRTFIYIYREKLLKHWYIPYIFIAFHLVFGVITIDTPKQILSILIPCFSCYYLWFGKDTQSLRVGNIIANTLWGVYNIINGLYIIIIMRLITIIANAVAYFKRSQEIYNEYRLKLIRKSYQL